MTVSVIVPVFDDWERLSYCLNALTAQSFSKKDTEIIVVSNEAEKGLPAGFSLPEGVQLVHEPIPGSYAARNKGADIASGELLLFTDSDCIPDKNWIAQMVQIFRDTGTDMVGGRVDIFRPEGGSRLSYIYQKETAFPQRKNVAEGHSVTANFAIVKSVFESLGGFRNDMKSGGDWEFTERAAGAGFSLVYGKDAMVRHPSSKNFRDIFKKEKRLCSWGSLNAQKKHKCSAIWVMGSYIKSGWKKNRENVSGVKKRLFIYAIDTVIYVYWIYTHLTIVLKLGSPEKIRR